MSEPRRIGDLLAETLAAIRAAGPVLTKLETSPEVYAALTTAHFAEQALHGYSASPWLGVPVYVRDRSNLPPWARREHYSDGRVVTRYRRVMDPRVLQVRIHWQTRHAGPPEEHTTDLTLQTRHGRSWLWAVNPEHGGAVTSAWKGARVSPYLPGLQALVERTGLELADWQRDYLGAAIRGHHASPIQLNVPRNFGRGLT